MGKDAKTEHIDDNFGSYPARLREVKIVEKTKGIFYVHACFESIDGKKKMWVKLHEC